MIELAPQHKIGLNLARPVLISSGCCGYGNAYQGLIDLSLFGGVVTQPITLRPQPASPTPRLAETRAGFILNIGQQNPGVKRVIRENRKSWPRLDIPIIGHLPADEPDNLIRTARALSGIQTPQGDSILAAFELGLPRDCVGADIQLWLRALQAGTELPLLVKIPIGASEEIVQAAVEGYADALVLGTPPLGSAFLPDSKQMVIGSLYGPALHSLVLHDLQRFHHLHLPRVAVGGIHSMADVEAYFEAGATAVQLDTLLFVDPNQAEAIARAFVESSY